MSARSSKGTRPIAVHVDPLGSNSKPQSKGRLIKAAKAYIGAKSAYKESKAQFDASSLLLTQEEGYIETETPLERTHKLQQDVLCKNHLDLSNIAKASFNLDLSEFGPYKLDITRSGRHLLIAGSKGHIATMEWKRSKLACEVFLNESVRDACWLHNETLFAVAQKSAVHIYDHSGLELHALRKHHFPQRLTFLPYHFLLASIGDPGVLVYQDTSTGTVISELSTKLGKCNVMAQNPWNAVIHCGHANGVVTMWSPSSGTPLAKMLAHKGALTALAVDSSGRHMATSAVDGQVKLWDLRNGFKPLHSYFSRAPASDLAFSQRGLLAVSWSSFVYVWKDVAVPGKKSQSPYLTHQTPNGSKPHQLQFVPFEDTLTIGHDFGVTTMIVPGSGEPNFDALEANPYETTKQRREHEVKQLLDKIPADTISLDPTVIGAVITDKDDRLARLPGSSRRENPAVSYGSDDNSNEAQAVREKKRISGQRKYLRKQKNVIDAKKLKIRRDLESRRNALGRTRGNGHHGAGQNINILDRFRS